MSEGGEGRVESGGHSPGLDTQSEGKGKRGPWPGRQGELVRRLQEGSADALAWVVREYRPALLRYARRIGGDLVQPEDIVQEAFLRFWRRRKELRPGGSIRALLFITVRSIARDEFRSWGRRVVLMPDGGETLAPSTPLDDVIRHELSARLDQAVGGLSPRRKQVFEMVRRRGMSHEEAARALGITRRTVTNTITSALTELRERLEDVA